MAITKEMFENFIADNNRFFLKGISESDNIIYHFSKMPIADKEHRVKARSNVLLQTAKTYLTSK